MKKLLTCLYFLLCAIVAFGQKDPELQAAYPFLQTDSNRIVNHHALDAFFEKLELLRQGKIKQVRILHIGDSHLQADFMTGESRRLFQEEFGNAGRGLVFPYRVAKTNGPPDYSSIAYGNWQAKRVVFPDQPLPIGVSGITLNAMDNKGLIYIKLREEDRENYAFNKVTVFRQTGLNYYDIGIGTVLPEIKESRTSDGYRFHTVRSGESLGIIASNYRTTVKQIKEWNHLRSDMIRAGQSLIVGVVYREVVADTGSVFQDLQVIPSLDGPAATSYMLPSLSTSVYIRQIRNLPVQTDGNLYGVSLENTEQSGILYHTVGVNGAQYSHYAQAAYFAEQTAMLQPDLIIFSLGTNESFATQLGEEEFYMWADSLVTRLTGHNPEASLLICSQPDTYTRRKYKNPRNLMIAATLRSYADDRYTGFWDMNRVMGGYGSMNNWFRAGLTAKDKVHFSVGGYRLQGQLLYNALMKSYELYRTGQH